MLVFLRQRVTSLKYRANEDPRLGRNTLSGVIEMLAGRFVGGGILLRRL